MLKKLSRSPIYVQSIDLMTCIGRTDVDPAPLARSHWAALAAGFIPAATRRTPGFPQLFAFQELQERGDDALGLAGIAAPVGDDRVLHRRRVLHLDPAQR